MKKIVSILLLAVFVLAFGVGFFASMDAAGACNCGGRCSPSICPAPCFCERVGSCRCLQCACP